MKQNAKKTALVFALAGTALASAVAIGSNLSASRRVIAEGNTPAQQGTGRTIYVSPTASDNGDGTKENPYTAFTVLNESVDRLQPGDTVYFAAGTYEVKNATRVYVSGTHDNYIKFMKDPETTGDVVLSFYGLAFSSLNRGVQLDGSYLYWNGIDICGAGDNGMYIGGSYNIVEDCEFYDNRDSGLQLGRSNGELNRIDQWPSYNLIKNCTSYNNYDNETYGENADGFAAKLTVGYGNIFDGCVAYRNSDDGWDLYAKTDSGTIGSVTIYNCVAFENGLIGETQASFNAKFPTYNHVYDEDNTASYLTRDGDGNGFKLGGSVMEGEVTVKNSVAFHNRMHGVTDNSNPGVISLDGITSYNNGVTAGENGDVLYAKGVDSYGNIDIARQTYSYNNFRDVLSINNGSLGLTADAYRGAAADSVLVLDDKNSMVIEGSIDSDSRVASKAGTKVSAPVVANVFEELPSLSLGKGNSTFHETKRNADGSLNLGDLLRIKNREAMFDGKDIGATLNASAWGEYEHPEYTDLSSIADANEAVIAAAKDILYIPADVQNVYQSFNVATNINGVEVSWSSSSDALVVGTEVETTVSKATRVNVRVNRPTDEDVQATLTATLSYQGKTLTKVFNLVVKKDIPTIGSIKVEGVVENRFILDQYDLISEPAITVNNGSYNDERALPESAYTVSRSYTYQANGNATPVPVKGITTSHAGIFNVTITATLKDSGESASTSYQVYIASKRATVDFLTDASTGESKGSLTVSKDGFILSGGVTNPTGSLYTLALPTGSEAPTKETILSEGEAYTFRDTVISNKVAHSNDEGYDVYYVFANMAGIATSEIGVANVTVSDIATKADLEAALANNNSHTIYRLTADIDCEGTLKTSTSNWVGLFNGMGHTISNVTISSTAGTTGIFPKVKGGTIENVNFSNINITDTGKKTGIIAEMNGGYIDNIGVDHCNIVSAERAGVIGHILSQTDDGLTVSEISRVKVTNTKILGNRAGGVVGFIQAGQASLFGKVKVSDCYVNAQVGDQSKQWQYVGGIIGRNDDRNVKDSLEVNHCVFAGKAMADKYCGGVVGDETGTGKTRIGQCLSLGELYYAMQQDKLTTAQKNCSPIFGKYAGNADCIVSQCYGLFEEYNSNYGVNVMGVNDYLSETFYFKTLNFDSTYWSVDATAGHIVLNVNA